MLDSDTLSLLARGNRGVCERVNRTRDAELFVAVVSVEELIRGRLAQVRAARTDEELERAYFHFQTTVEFVRAVQNHPMDSGAIQRFNDLRTQFRRRGTNDLRIAAIALERGCTLVSRNVQDFSDIPDLPIENWAT